MLNGDLSVGVEEGPEPYPKPRVPRQRFPGFIRSWRVCVARAVGTPGSVPTANVGHSLRDDWLFIALSSGGQGPSWLAPLLPSVYTSCSELLGHDQVPSSSDQ